MTLELRLVYTLQFVVIMVWLSRGLIRLLAVVVVLSVVASILMKL